MHEVFSNSTCLNRVGSFCEAVVVISFVRDVRM